jgi:hypothetical protein
VVAAALLGAGPEDELFAVDNELLEFRVDAVF